MTELTDLMRAMRGWQACFPDEFGPCCSDSHYWPQAHPDSPQVPLPDNLVCEREQAWRRYVRLRDVNPEWPWTKPEIKRPQRERENFCDMVKVET